ncbi:MAG: hypothetical protein ACI8W8_001038, partial [Rhodothermales bacterium]
MIRFASFFAALFVGAQVLVPQHATWAYLDGEAKPPTGWQQPDFDDSGWKRGKAPLGYSRDDLGTTISFGRKKGRKAISASFRHRFEVADAASLKVLTLQLSRDDGAAVYINGQLVARSNLPDGPIMPETKAAKTVGNEAETTVHEIDINPKWLVNGPNVLAVSVHQVRVESSDLGFTLSLAGNASLDIALRRGPYLQSMSTNAVVVCWRSNLSGVGEVRLDGRTIAGPAAKDHEIRVDGLKPATGYTYSVHVGDTELAAGELRTAPEAGSDTPLRIWVIGDSGTANANSRRVYSAYAKFAKERPADLWLMLGDNAYQKGTDAQFQKAVFETYPELLRQRPMFSTRGNHAANADVYYAIHANPTKGECGGLPSGTEAYYAVDYGNAHLICLDSAGSDTGLEGEMRRWLKADLAATKQLWRIAFFHHPPYSKGSHNSDAEAPLGKIRASLLPVLERGGVDLVLVGHSHCYERSMLVHGHYGRSAEFDKSRMAVDESDG